MLIDWYTVAAQALNFLVLVALLKIFLFDRVVKIMDQRQQSIDERLRQAREEREQAEALRLSLEAERSALEENRDRELRRAAQEADERRRELLEQARKEVDGQREAWRESLRRERDDLDRRLAGVLAGGVLDVSARALGDLAGQDMIPPMADRFLDELRALPEQERKALVRGAGESGVLEIAAFFPLPASERERVAGSVREILGTDAKIRFTESSDAPGMVVSADGRRFGWDVTRYFDRLAESVEEVLAGGDTGEGNHE
ncbi:hypothetical protein [Salidesulfovibrio onnuriiensis]|uniref:F0F1 ATP synthase subunit B family protein n=1 Tax=Salidesulfovibrio onnuriiensis TaxID=2583823 RepID=UPI0016505FD2|nr:hypothetical protein [Salidesulfovibrio onnuriiensis]